jgi:hypothetical protein
MAASSWQEVRNKVSCYFDKVPEIQAPEPFFVIRLYTIVCALYELGGAPNHSPLSVRFAKAIIKYRI